MHVAVIKRRRTRYEMHMFAIADWNRRSGSDSSKIMKMVQEIGMRKVDFMDMAIAYPDGLPGNAGESMIMSVFAFLG
jgi:hypothetical protein